jgi:mannose-6-phosphate isomerase
MTQRFAPGEGLHGLRDWLLHTSLPLWLAHGVDRAAGGFHEHLSADTYICSADYRRLRVAARQTYVFARAYSEGLAGADEAACLGIEFLRRHAALPDGGYAARFDLAGNPTDTTRDLYDHAFVLLALATATHVLPADPLRREALSLLDFITMGFAHPAGGYHESLPAAQPRRQNPHMHLLEAMLAAHGAFGDPVFLDTAHDLVALSLAHFIDPDSGGMLEFFDNDLAPLPGAAQQVEPGHCCEWIWLLQSFQAATGHDPRIADAVRALAAFVQRHGIHTITGDLVDAVTRAGAPLAATSRLWPQTERLKASASARATERLATWLHPDGLWTERRDALGRDLPGPVPASSLYHLTCALLDDSRKEGVLF